LAKQLRNYNHVKYAPVGGAGVLARGEAPG
jgi:hypothetical protein